MSDVQPTGQTVETALAVSAAVSEYTGLRAEIAQRSTSQSQLVVAAVTVTGLGLTAGLVTNGWAAAALGVPILCAVLGLMWGDHAVQIEKAGAYIEHVATPHLRALTGDAHLMTWEQVTKVDMKSSPRVLARLGVPVLAMSIVPSLSAIALAWPEVDSVGEWFLLALGFVLEALFVSAWWRVLRPLGDDQYRRALAQDMQSLLSGPPRTP